MKKKSTPTFMEIYKSNPMPADQQISDKTAPGHEARQSPVLPTDESRSDISRLVKIILPSSLAVLFLAVAFYAGASLYSSGTLTIRLSSIEYRSTDQRNMALAQYDKIIAALDKAGITKDNECWIRIDGKNIALCVGKFYAENDGFLQKIKGAKVRVDGRDVAFSNAVFIDVR